MFISNSLMHVITSTKLLDFGTNCHSIQLIFTLNLKQEAT